MKMDFCFLQNIKKGYTTQGTTQGTTTHFLFQLSSIINFLKRCLRILNQLCDLIPTYTYILFIPITSFIFIEMMHAPTDVFLILVLCKIEKTCMTCSRKYKSFICKEYICML